MSKKVNVSKVRRQNLIGDDGVIDRLERMSIGLLYAGTELSQDDIAQIMGMGKTRVNDVLRGIKKPGKSK